MFLLAADLIASRSVIVIVNPFVVCNVVRHTHRDFLQYFCTILETKMCTILWPRHSSAVKKTARIYSQSFFRDGCCIQSVMKNRDFRHISFISLYLANDTRYGHSYNKRQIGTRIRSIEFYHFSLTLNDS